jgi:hypothetical protein
VTVRGHRVVHDLRLHRFDRLDDGRAHGIGIQSVHHDGHRAKRPQHRLLFGTSQRQGGLNWQARGAHHFARDE